MISFSVIWFPYTSSVAMQLQGGFFVVTNVTSAILLCNLLINNSSTCSLLYTKFISFSTSYHIVERIIMRCRYWWLQWQVSECSRFLFVVACWQTTLWCHFCTISVQTRSFSIFAGILKKYIFQVWKIYEILFIFNEVWMGKGCKDLHWPCLGLDFWTSSSSDLTLDLISSSSFLFFVFFFCCSMFASRSDLVWISLFFGCGRGWWGVEQVQIGLVVMGWSR